MSRTYTKSELIAICQKAKEFLWDGKGIRPKGLNTWVCYALSAASPKGQTPKELEDLVDAHLQGEVFMTSLLREKFGRLAVDKMTPEQIQAWRFLMLDNMIKILRKGGKK
jgi:hypothetical protein